MKVTKEISIEGFEGWSGAENTIDIIVNADKVEEFDQMIEELHPDGIDETELNDLLRFEDDWIYTMLDITIDEEDEE